MSTATFVPETWELTGDDARATLRSTGRRALVVGAFQRMRFSDGFSHARSLAFLVSMMMAQGVVALVGVAAALNRTDVSDVIVRSITGVVPGPAGTELTSVVQHAAETGAGHQWIPILLGTVAALVSGTTAFGQLERALNRIYGVELDRPFAQKYGRAFLLALTAGTLLAVSFAILAFGRTIGTATDNHVLDRLWTYLRWPLAVVILGVATTLLFERCPRRHQPGRSWLAFGAGLSVGLVTLVTVLLGAFFHTSKSFGNTYGPLAGLLALLLWAMLAAMALLLGAAAAAQLESMRAGKPEPQDEEKVEASEPVLAEAS